MSRSDPAGAVTALVDAVNRGDFDAAIGAFSDGAVIVEDLAPYRWTGRSAPSSWLAAMGENAGKLGISSVVMEAGQPSRTEIEGDRAYLIVPGLLRYVTAGGQLRADGTITFTLVNRSGTWLIDTLVWSGPRAS